MRDGGYDNQNSRKAGCGCVAIGGIAILIAWFVLFVLSLGDCLAPDNVACHNRAVRETTTVGVALVVFILAGGTFIFWRFLKRK
jgi:hypothetical protein